MALLNWTVPDISKYSLSRLSGSDNDRQGDHCYDFVTASIPIGGLECAHLQHGK